MWCLVAHLVPTKAVPKFCKKSRRAQRTGYSKDQHQWSNMKQCELDSLYVLLCVQSAVMATFVATSWWSVVVCLLSEGPSSLFLFSFRVAPAHRSSSVWSTRLGALVSHIDQPAFQQRQVTSMSTLQGYVDRKSPVYTRVIVILTESQERCCRSRPCHITRWQNHSCESSAWQLRDDL